MIRDIFILGTSAEMIKMSTLISLFPNSAVINTRQQDIHLKDFIINSGNVISDLLEVPDSADVLKGLQHSPWWIANRSLYVFRSLSKLGRHGIRNRKFQYIYIHGDTLTSGMAAIIGRLMRFNVVHVEAGLRSKSILNPFPEELTRLSNTFFATIHFAPDQMSLSNLEKARGKKYCSNGNTFLDSLPAIDSGILPREYTRNFVLVHMHRLEFLKNTHIFRETVSEILKLKKQFEVRVVGEKHFVTKLKATFEVSEIEGLIILPKLDRKTFLQLCLESEFVITDSGGTQEELAVLGVPTLLHRKFTERFDGLDSNIRLSNWSISSIGEFAISYGKYRRPRVFTKESPSKFIHDKIRDIRD
jgi:UDP-N-acetylglucosamine 2-epimerase (non-hydrolysing)